MKLEPSRSISFLIRYFAPSPIAITQMIDTTPMIIPRVVSVVRTLCFRRDLRALAIIVDGFILLVCPI